VNKSNDVSAERQLRTTDRSIRAVVQELAQQQEMVAVWDDAVLELNKNRGISSGSMPILGCG